MNFPDRYIEWEAAVRSGLKHRIEIEILHGTDVNQCFGDLEDTALHIACIHGDISVIILLIENGADVNRKNLNLKTPLHIAALHRNYDAVDLLIKHGALKNELDWWGDSPVGVCLNNPRMVKFLIEHGCSVFTKEPHQYSVLNQAINVGNTETVRLLLQQGMDPRCPEPNGHDQFHRLHAVKDEIASILLKTAFNLDEAESKIRLCSSKRRCECEYENRKLKTKPRHSLYES